MNDLTETWLIHDRMNRYLLDAIDEAILATASPSKGRNIWEQFTHIHNVRLMWLKASMPELMAAQTKAEKGDTVSKKKIAALLQQSGEAIGKLLEKGVADGKIKGFKPHPSAFLGYLIAHESHHRGQITFTLRQLGHKLDQKVSYGMWEWGSR